MYYTCIICYNIGYGSQDDFCVIVQWQARRVRRYGAGINRINCIVSYIYIWYSCILFYDIVNIMRWALPHLFVSVTTRNGSLRTSYIRRFNSLRLACWLGRVSVLRAYEHKIGRAYAQENVNSPSKDPSKDITIIILKAFTVVYNRCLRVRVCVSVCGCADSDVLCAYSVAAVPLAASPNQIAHCHPYMRAIPSHTRSVEVCMCACDCADTTTRE